MQLIIFFIIGLVLACFFFPGAVILVTMLIGMLAEIIKLLMIVFIVLAIIGVFVK